MRVKKVTVDTKEEAQKMQVELLKKGAVRVKYWRNRYHWVVSATFKKEKGE